MSSERQIVKGLSGWWTQRCRPLMIAGLLLPVLLAAPQRVMGALTGESEVGRTPPRLSFVVGEVSFWRPGTDEWAPAQVNMALAPEDALHAGAGSRAEVQIGGRAFVRLGDDSQLAIVSQEPDFLQLKINSGRAALDARELGVGRTVQIDTPNAAVTVEEPGYYRFDVTQDATTLVVRRGGHARARALGGETMHVSSNDRLVIDGSDTPGLAVYNASPLDDWDSWNYERTERVLTAASARYLPRDVYGAEALDDYGTWRVVPTYGRVWVPGYVTPGWAPYSTGQWVWDAYYGWTWLDAAPWGWAPFHYGRWVYASNYWAWAPGPIIARPVYAPALVAFFGGAGFQVSVGVPFVSWVALGWGEPLVPWWGARGFIGVPCWRGWGGPRVVNNTYVTNTTVVNVYKPGAYANTHVRDGVVTAPRDGFGHRPVERLRAAAVTPHDLRPLGANVPGRPVSTAHRPTAPDRPRANANTAPSGRDAPRSTMGGRSPEIITRPGDGRMPALPRDVRGNADHGQRPSSARVQEAPRVAPRQETGRGSFNEMARREPPPPQARGRDDRPASSTYEQQRPAASTRFSNERRASLDTRGADRSAAPPPPPAVAPPIRQAEREPSRGWFGAADRPHSAPPAQAALPPPISAPPAPARVEGAMPAPAFGGRGDMGGPAPMARSADPAPAAAAPAPAAQPRMHSGGGAPRGHGVHSR